ncbi:hypothetical protein [Mesorhizobium sp. A556]
MKTLPGEKDAEFVKRIVRAYHDEHDRRIAESWKAAAEAMAATANRLVAEWAKAIKEAKRDCPRR